MLAAVGVAVCVGAVVAVWVAGALYNALRTVHNASHVPRERTRSQPGSTALIVVAVACAGLAVVSRSHFDGLAVGASWPRVLGFVVLVASTVFTLWARFSLGTMWSLAPQVKDDHRLRTHGPYAVTRHPIYTGVLGMLLGATLLSGIGQWIVLFPVGLILFEVKIRMEEHLMLATLPSSTPGTADRCHNLSQVSSYCVDATQSARRPSVVPPGWMRARLVEHRAGGSGRLGAVPGHGAADCRRAGLGAHHGDTG